jgi:multicomponent Na+:H+ antiporter subunit C
MEPLLAILVGLFFACAIYLMMSRYTIRILMGVAILGNAVNLLIFTAGRLTRDVPPVIPAALDVPDGVIANPLPQALILTAIVISFSFLAFMLVLGFRAYQDLDTDDSRDMRLAEPENEPLPPLGY